MIVECLIKRDGVTPVTLEGVRYLFMPNRLGGISGPVTSVCEITTEKHLDVLLKTGQYREYKDGQPLPDEPKTINMSGYSICKHVEGRTEGYRIEDRRTKETKYVGSDMVWRKDLTGLVPFDTEFNAWTWLKEEIEMDATDQVFTDEPDFLALAGRKKPGRPPKEG